MRGPESTRPYRCKDGGRRIARRGVSEWLVVAALAAGLVFSGVAQAATPVTLYVDQHNASCSATGAGTSEQPFCTIGAAAAKAGPGNTVLVAAGSYTEKVKPLSGGTSESPLTFMAAPGGDCRGDRRRLGTAGLRPRWAGLGDGERFHRQAATPGATLKLRLSEWTGATAVGQAKTTITLSTDWQPIKVRYTAAAPGSSTLDLSSYVHDAPPGSCFSADDISIAWG